MRIDPVHSDPRVVGTIDLLQHLTSSHTAQQAFDAFISRYFTLRPVDYFFSVLPDSSGPGHYRVPFRISRDMIEAHAPVPKRNPRLDEIESLPVHRGGLFGNLIATPEPKLARDLDLSQDPVLAGSVSGVRTAMALPLYAGTHVVEWVMGLSRQAEGFGPADVQNALMIANLMGMTNAHLLSVEEISRLNRALTGQFEEVAKIQQALLPTKIPEIPRVSIATSYLTCDSAGGDYYNFFPLTRGRWGFTIADVSGHGAGAATVMAMLHAIFNCYDQDVHCPAHLLSYANTKLLGSNIGGSFVTAFLGIFDPATGELVYANAGHPPPRLKRASDGSVIALDGASTLPLGVLGPMEMQRESVLLDPRDTVILYTDGIVEEFSPQREMFAVHRLDQALNHCSGDPDCVMESVHTALYSHTGKRTRADDQTLVAFRYHGAEVPVRPTIKGALS